jgi:hypothetical protein
MYYGACCGSTRPLDAQQLMRPLDVQQLMSPRDVVRSRGQVPSSRGLPYHQWQALPSSRGLPYLVRSRGQCLPLVHLCKRDHRGAAFRLALEVRRRSKELGGYVLPRHLRVKLRVKLAVAAVAGVAAAAAPPAGQVAGGQVSTLWRRGGAARSSAATCCRATAPPAGQVST